MGNDLFLKSLFLIILKKNNFEFFGGNELKNWKKKKQSLTHSQFRQAKRSVSIKSHIRFNIKFKNRYKKNPTVKIYRLVPFTNSFTKLHNVPDPSILLPPPPALPDLIITLQLSITHSIDHQTTKETLVFTFDGLDSLKSREAFFFFFFFLSPKETRLEGRGRRRKKRREGRR